jgi:hypothetical protein
MVVLFDYSSSIVSSVTLHMRVLSRSSSSFSRSRSCSRNSTTTIGSITTSEEALNQMADESQCGNKQASPTEQRCELKNSPEHRRCLAEGGGDIPPHSMGWRRADPTARTPTVRTHAAMIFISYYGQRRTGQVLKISVMKGRLFI